MLLIQDFSPLRIFVQSPLCVLPLCRPGFRACDQGWRRLDKAAPNGDNWRGGVRLLVPPPFLTVHPSISIAAK